MKLKKLKFINKTLTKIRNDYSKSVSNDAKIDMDEVIDFFNNIIVDASKEKEKNKTLLYRIRIET